MKVIEIKDCDYCPHYKSVPDPKGFIVGTVKCEATAPPGLFIEEETQSTDFPDWCPLPDKEIK